MARFPLDEDFPADWELRARLDLADRRQRMFRRLLGDRTAEVLGSRDAATRACADTDPRIRQGAFLALAHCWTPNADEKDRYEQTLLSDPDDDVRQAAAICLWELCRTSKDKHVSGLFAKIVENDSNSVDLRRIAYLALCAIQDVQVPAEVAMALYTNREALPSSLDWAMVKSFAI